MMGSYIYYAHISKLTTEALKHAFKSEGITYILSMCIYPPSCMLASCVVKLPAICGPSSISNISIVKHKNIDFILLYH